MSNNQDKYMFDSQIFAEIIYKKLSIEEIKNKFEYVITHIQKDEIEQIKSITSKRQLLNIFNTVSAENIPTSGCILGVSRLNAACLFTEEDALIDEIANNLPIKTKNKTKEEDERNRLRDALIANTCIKNDYILVTEDRNLFNQVKKHKGKTKKLTEFLELCKKNN